MTAIDATLADLRDYLDDHEPDALATVFVENNQFHADFAGDAAEIAPEYLLAALLNHLAALRDEHPEDTARRVLAAAQRLDHEKDGELFVDRSNL